MDPAQVKHFACTSGYFRRMSHVPTLCMLASYDSLEIWSIRCIVYYKATVPPLFLMSEA